MKSFIRVAAPVLVSGMLFTTFALAGTNDLSSSIACRVQLSGESTETQVGNDIRYQLAAVSKRPIARLSVNGEVRDLEDPQTFLLTSGHIATTAAGTFQIQVTVFDGVDEASCSSPDIVVNPLPECTPPQEPVTQQMMITMTELRLVAVTMQAVKTYTSCHNP